MSFLPEFLVQNLPFLLVWSLGALAIGLRKTYAPNDVFSSLLAARVYFWLLPIGLFFPKMSLFSTVAPVLSPFVMDAVVTDAVVLSARLVQESVFSGIQVVGVGLAVWLVVAALLVISDLLLLWKWISSVHAHAEKAAWPDSFRGKAGSTDLYVLNSALFPACTFSGFRNKVFVPQALFSDPGRADMVLRHELSHVQHHDFFHALLEQLLKRMLWFWPPVTLLARQLSLLRELRCDLESVPTTDSVSYASLLLDQAQIRLRSNLSPALSSSAKHLKIRIQMIRSFQNKTPGHRKSGVFIPLFFALTAFACDQALQVNTPAKISTTDDVFVEVETHPSIVGGIEALAAKIVYPESAKNEGVQGRVMVSLVVNKEGKPEQIHVETMTAFDENKTPFKDERLEKAAVEAIEKLTFEPGILGGKKVNAKLVIPIVFRISEGSANVIGTPNRSNRGARLVANYAYKPVTPQPVVEGDGC